jgi:hypothetical protein
MLERYIDWYSVFYLYVVVLKSLMKLKNLNDFTKKSYPHFCKHNMSAIFIKLI